MSKRQQRGNSIKHEEFFHLVMKEIERIKTWELKPGKFKLEVRYRH